MSAVSIIIPTYNRAQKTARAIASVLTQSFRDFELIVVDDGSDDETAAMLDRWRGHILSLSHHQNRGVSAARNTGIKASHAPLVAFLDSDDYWLPDKLAVQVSFFQDHPEALICQTEELWIRHGRRHNPRKKHRKPSGDIFTPSLKLCLVSPSAVMLKRTLLDQVGLFDETLPACEDYDLWLRIACRYPVYLIDQPLLVKEGGEPDQLSARIGSLDQYRIKALVKLIRSGGLNPQQLRATLDELSIKCRIYGNGCLKRGKKAEGDNYLQLTEKIIKDYPL